MDIVSHSAKAGQLEVGEHEVRVVRSIPATYELNGEAVPIVDYAGRVKREITFADDAGFVAKMWVAPTGIYRPNGAPSRYGSLHLAAGLSALDPPEAIVGARLRIAVHSNGRGRNVVVGLQALRSGSVFGCDA